VPCFADERLFSPAVSKRAAVAYAPRKRPIEANAIQSMFRRFHPPHAALPGWRWQTPRSSGAQAFGGSSLHLSLSRLESVGMTTLEAMATAVSARGSPA